MHNQQRIFVAGHWGLAGRAICRQLRDWPGVELLTRTHEALDLTEQAAVEAFMRVERPDQVYLPTLAAVDTQAAGTRPADSIHEHLAVETHVIHAAHAAGVRRLLFLGSSCIYPREAPQPIPEDALLTGPPEPASEPMQLPRSPASSSARATTGSTERTTDRSCQPLFMGRATTITRRTVLSFPA